MRNPPVLVLTGLALSLLAPSPARSVQIDEVQPASGSLGTVLEISGMDFGEKKPKVFLNRDGLKKPIKLKVIDSGDTVIRALLKKAGPPGLYDLHVESKESPPDVEEGAFQIRLPIIDSIDPLDPAPGEEVTILGSFFGTKKGKVIITTTGEEKGKKAKVLEWVDPVPVAVANVGPEGSAPQSRIVAAMPKKPMPGSADLSLQNKVGELTLEGVLDLPVPPLACKGNEVFLAAIVGDVNGTRAFDSNSTTWERPFGGSQIIVQGCRAPNIECDETFVVNAFYNPDLGPATLECGLSQVFADYSEDSLGGNGRSYTGNTIGASCTVEIELSGDVVEGSVSGSFVQEGVKEPEVVEVQGCFRTNQEIELEF